MSRILFFLFVVALLFRVHAETSSTGNWKAETARPGTVMLYNDNGAWPGICAKGLAVLSGPSAVIRKEFDLSRLPPEVLKQVKNAVLRVQIGIVDFSAEKPGKTPNGLNEEFTVSINGHEMLFSTADPRFPAKGLPSNLPSDADSIGLGRKNNKRRQEFVDIPFPVEWIQSGRMTVEMRKKPSRENDDFVSVGIDITAPNTASRFSFNGGRAWQSGTGCQPEGMGEYLMRLILSDRSATETATVTGDGLKRTDREGLVGFLEYKKPTLYVEFDRNKLNPSAIFECIVENGVQPRFLDGNGLEITPLTVSENGKTLLRFAPEKLLFSMRAKTSPEKIFQFRYSPAPTLPEARVDMTPEIALPKGQRAAVSPECRISGNSAFLKNTALAAEFKLKPKLELVRLEAAEVASDILRFPEKCELFLLRCGPRTWSCRNMEVKEVISIPNGFAARLFATEARLECLFSAIAEKDELRLKLEVVNRGTAPVEILPVFPHLDGIGISKDVNDDYFLFPWGGGTISNHSSRFRAVYGTNSCWWQMIDLFSPERGGGVYLRTDDPAAIYKGFNLRKGAACPQSYVVSESFTPGRDPMQQFTDSLGPVPGIGLSVDYQAFTRTPSGVLRLPDACIGTHAGNWKAAMARYTAWSKKTWPPRRLSPKLAARWNSHGGIGHRENTARHQTSFLTPKHDLIELDSYWTLSDLAPWGTPWEEYDKIAEDGKKRFLPNWVDKASGKRLYALNRGDYDGYNPQWGGLPALCRYIEELRGKGYAVLLYTDPVIACHNTKNGPKLAEKFGIENPDWRPPELWPRTPKPPKVTAYYSYCLDVNVDEYADWIARTMARLCRETGADGIRFDEFGHRGYICLARNHKHLFGEFGQNAWLQAVKHCVEKSRAAMDKVNSSLIIMTEFPGHDALASTLDGALSYDLCRRTGPNVNVPINLFRFYFPECKLFELDVNGPKNAKELWLWNAVGACFPMHDIREKKILDDYSDAFNGNAEALVPTLRKDVYANRFSAKSGSVTIYTLYNHTGFTVDDLLLEAKPDCRYRDLRHALDLPVIRRGGISGVKIRIPRDSTAAIAELKADSDK